MRRLLIKLKNGAQAKNPAEIIDLVQEKVYRSHLRAIRSCAVTSTSGQLKMRHSPRDSSASPTKRGCLPHSASLARPPGLVGRGLTARLGSRLRIVSLG